MSAHGRACDCDDCWERDRLAEIDRSPCYADDCGEHETDDGHMCALRTRCPRHMARVEVWAMRDGG